MLKWVNVFLQHLNCCSILSLYLIAAVTNRWGILHKWSICGRTRVPVVFVIFFKLLFKTIPSVASFAAKFTCTSYYGKKLLLRHEKYYA